MAALRTELGPQTLAALDGWVAADAATPALDDARRSAYAWCRRFAGGDAVVVGARRPIGPLSVEQERALLSSMRGTRLWTPPSVAELALERFGVTLAVDRYLRAWGLGPRDPLDRACSLCARSMARWLAEFEVADALWAGRTRLLGISDVVAAYAPDGRVRFMLSDDPSAFLAALILDEGGPVDVVLDGSWPFPEGRAAGPEGVVLHALPTCTRDSSEVRPQGGRTPLA